MSPTSIVMVIPKIWHPQSKRPAREFARTGRDAIVAIHGRFGARVALLQSPILRTVPQDSTVRVEKNWSSGYPVMFRSNGTT